jgi:glucosamine--fructose-6-phosphate aminotransferase (isomerizing)
MDKSTFVIVLNPDDSTYTDTLTSSKEIKSRGAKIIGISDKNNDVYDYWVKIHPLIQKVQYFLKLLQCNCYSILQP